MNAISPGTELRQFVAPLWRILTPLCVMVFAEFLAMGVMLPALPGQVHQALGFGTFLVGIVIGAQSWATLATRHLAGTRTDRVGPRGTVAIGLSLSALAGLLSATSVAVSSPAASLGVLLLGRGVLGLGESFVITGALAWGVGLAGKQRSGVVMAWVGIAMYGALAAGSPLGSTLAQHLGFIGVAAAAIVAPLAGLAALPLVAPVEPAGGSRLPFHRVAGLLWLPGLGLSLAALGFGAIAAFTSFLFEARGWANASLAMTAFGAAYVLARLLFGGLPDRFGGAQVAAASAAVAALGQLGLWLAPSSVAAVAAAALTGLGFSLAFPAFGVEAIRRVPPQNRGVALGAYSAFFDATMGLGVPLLGLAVGSLGPTAAFAAGTLSALASLLIALSLVLRPAKP